MANINGNDADNTLEGFSTDDVIRGFHGHDTIDGHDGQDLLYGNQDNDHIDGGEGDDTIYGGQNDDCLSGADGRDLMYGNYGDDTLQGNENQDTMYGGQGEDFLTGGDDNDLLYGNRDQDSLYGDEGNDTLYGGYDESEDELDGSLGNDVLYGGPGDDYLSQQYSGKVGEDCDYTETCRDAYCDNGNDTLYGGDGDDWIESGDRDHDNLWGDAGADTFDFEGYNKKCYPYSECENGTTEDNTERVMDFETGTDLLYISYCEEAEHFYLEIEENGVNSVEDAIAFVDAHETFEADTDEGYQFVFIAGSDHGYLLVNKGDDYDDDEWECEEGDYVIVLQNLNDISEFGAGDISAFLEFFA